MLSGCNRISCDTGIGTCDEKKWSDPNYDIISVSAYNYTDYEIGRFYLIPIDKNDIAFGAMAPGANRTPRGAKRWVGGGGSSPALAWDLRWKSPHKFKVCRLRVVDEKVLSVGAD